MNHLELDRPDGRNAPPSTPPDRATALNETTSTPSVVPPPRELQTLSVIPPPPGLEPGGPTTERVGKFEVVRRLGAGGQATTLLVFDPDLRRHVVLKRYHAADASTREAVLREGQALARVRSPYVVQVHAVERLDDAPCLVMEFIRGQSLLERLQKGPLPLPEALDLVTHLAEGLTAVHACGLLHRDIKPGNILLGEDGVPRLVDFGLSAQLASQELAHGGGTLPYVPPEQIRGEVERIDARTDVFGLGAVLYELVTGRPVYDGKTQEALFAAAWAAAITPPRLVVPNLDPDLERVLQRCLAVDPAQRYGSARELADELRTLRRPRRRRFLWPASVGLAILALLGAAWLTWLRPGPPGPLTPESASGPGETNPRSDFALEVEIVGGRYDRHEKKYVLKDGQYLSFRIRSPRRCRVGVWSVSVPGAITQLFPNRNEPDNLIEANVARLVPGKGGKPIRARVSAATEHVHVFATTGPWPELGGTKAGPFAVFGSEKEKSALGEKLRGLELADDDHHAISEVILPYVVRKP